MATGWRKKNTRSWWSPISLSRGGGGSLLLEKRTVCIVSDRVDLALLTDSDGKNNRMVTEKGSAMKIKLLALMRGLKNLLGVGLYLLLLGLLLEGLTVILWQWVSIPIPLTLVAQVLLTVPCAVACIVGVIWFNRTLNLVKAHLLGGQHELVTHGLFTYVRHPLYATIMMTIPPLVIVWFADLVFVIPWILIVIASHYIVAFEERGLIEAFGEEYERYRSCVPALLPYKGAGGRRYLERGDDLGSKPGEQLHTIVALVLLLISCGQPVASPGSDIEERIRRVENGLLLSETIADRMETHNVPGASIAVINNFEIEWARGYGVLELGGDEPVTPDTLFQASSIAKPVTAVGALHYVEQGLLALDQDVNDRLVSWRIPENEFTAQADVTLRRLLSHTAGVNQGLNRGYAPGEEVPTLKQSLDGEPPANSLPVRVDRIPGTEEYYSNGGYLIVVQLLEDVLGKPFSEVMEEAVFEPVGMTNSTFEQKLPAELEARAAKPHGWDVIAWRESPGLVGETHIQDPGYGGLWTTAHDLALLANEVMRAYAGESETVLSQDMVSLMLTPVAEGIPLQEPFDADQALGFSLLHLGQETFMIHFGGSFPGYISVLVAQPERGFGAVIMTNAWSGDELIWEILYSIFYAYGILPTTGQILGIGYSLLLFLTVFALWPVSHVVRKLRAPKSDTAEAERRQKSATIARIVAILVVTAILVLSLLYRGPLGGYLVHSLDRGETPLTKALLGLFFSTPIALVIFAVLAWKNQFWSILERVQYTLVVVGALVGVYILRDLWALMFWG